MTDDEGGRLRRAMRRLTAPAHELDAEELQRSAENLGAQPVSECVDRMPATVFGTVRALTIRPRAGTPALEAELYDGSGVVTLVFVGRRTIAGIEPGRRLRATGRVTATEGRRLMFNPRYELLAE
ncbi:MAG: OB-fold nucleic acid binding domain-containing protein [Frankiaceae bacterium]|nr:OB-fold nucleic acid binding domain-containing protein [Frankiaceae bacterium]MBV9369554.1 OB-fold nucleic acid binding domain-containing protein [Frankiales bacterium]